LVCFLISGFGMLKMKLLGIVSRALFGGVLIISASCAAVAQTGAAPAAPATPPSAQATPVTPAATQAAPPSAPTTAASRQLDYVLGPGDVVKISVFQNPDLTVEARVSESGDITYPLIGGVKVGGLTLQAAENLVAQRLREGNFILKPQVNMLLVQIRGNQVAVLGQVNRPGRYPLETFTMRVSDMVAMAGGVGPLGADTVVLVGTRNGQAFRREIDMSALFQQGVGADLTLSGGDVLYVPRQQTFYIYGEVQKAGSYRLEREMTVMQALATGGGLTPRGTVKGIRIHRRNAKGQVETIEPRMEDAVRPDDVLLVRESLF
jgi:polysaccharide biosynthesis/export protein